MPGNTILDLFTFICNTELPFSHEPETEINPDPDAFLSLLL
jgi:hypothetical protein